MGRIADFPWGWVGTYDDNELEVVSTRSDPPKVRLAVEAGLVESNLGAVSFNLRRPDGRHEEYGYVMGRLTADKQEGALYVALRPRGEQQSREVLYIDPNQAIFRVPVSAPNLGGGGTPSILASPNGRVVLAAQSDGNLVLYMDGTAVKAVFGLPPEMLW